MEFIVCKFGGTSVATKEAIEQVEKIIDQNTHRRCIVLSAPGKAVGIKIKVTDLLIAAAKNAFDHKDYKAELADLKKRYRDIYEPIGVPAATVTTILDELDRRFAATMDNFAKFRDHTVAIGEELSARLFAEYLKSKGKKAVFISPQEAGLIVTADFGNAQPIADVAIKLAGLKKICAEQVVVFPGFFGVTASGDIATFSRGGSDLTGALMAEALDAREYENFTDVDGIFSASPVMVDKPAQIPALTYREMRELSYMGFNVFHEEAVWPAMRKKIPIRLRNTWNLDNQGTLIVAERLPGERDVIGIASSSGYCSFTLQKYLLNREKGFGRRLLQIFEELKLSYEHCPSGVDNISIILEQDQLKPDDVNTLIRHIEEQLRPDDIKTEFGIALVAVVGEGLLHKIGVLGQSAKALSDAGVNIKMVNQGSSEMNIIFGLDASDEKKALNALYDVFFRRG